MPRDYPDFPHHTQVAAYFEAYVDHFGFRDRITFETGVAHASRAENGLWDVELDTGETRRYDALAVCNGHHWSPRWPSPPFAGTFDGDVSHAHHYVDASRFAGKNVVVVGMGNSAMDIAVEIGDVATRTFLSARRGAYVVPKYLFGRPLDQFATQAWLPWPVRRTIFQLLLRVAVGRMEKYGLPRPDHRFGEAHPTVSGLILDRIGHGCVIPKPNIGELLGDRVRFVDGSLERVDAIVYCTGYNVKFPFFDSGFLCAPENELPLYHRVFKPGVANLFFIGLLQPLGAIMPLAELQSTLVAEYLLGRYALPPRKEMERAIVSEQLRMRRRYVASPRHTMQVDFDDYVVAVRRELRRGAKRAARMKLKAWGRAATSAGSGLGAVRDR